MENVSKLHLHPSFSPSGAASPEGPRHGTAALTALHKSVLCVFLSTSPFFHLLGRNYERVALHFHKILMQSSNCKNILKKYDRNGIVWFCYES